MDLKEIQNLIKFVAKSGASEVKLEMGDVKITIKTGSGKAETTIIQQPAQVSVPVAVPAEQAAPAPAQPSQDTAPEASKADDTSKYIEIKSPIIGTLYRKPSPDKPPFVKVGDTIEFGTQRLTTPRPFSVKPCVSPTDSPWNSQGIPWAFRKALIWFASMRPLTWATQFSGFFIVPS